MITYNSFTINLIYVLHYLMNDNNEALTLNAIAQCQLNPTQSEGTSRRGDAGQTLNQLSDGLTQFAAVY